MENARKFDDNIDISQYAWISISDPKNEKTLVSNPILDKCNKIKLSFFDISIPIDDDGNFIEVIKNKDLRKLKKFIIDNLGKLFIVNCIMGVSRSAAICKHLEINHGYKWEIQNNFGIVPEPNKYIIKLLNEN